MKSELIVYTALFGDYDKLRDPAKEYPGCKFVCFTDQKNLKSSIWDIRQVVNDDLPATMKNRHYKFFPHIYFCDYEYSLYVDANIRLIGNPADLVSKYLSRNVMACPSHFERDCLYEEGEICVQVKKANEEDVTALLDLYKKEGFPKHYGLAENNIIFRKHNDAELKKIMAEWWFFINKGPKRDQLSLMYLCWKNEFTLKLMDESSRNKNKYFRFMLHKNNGSFFRRVQMYINGNRQRNLFLMILWFFCNLYKKSMFHVFFNK